VLPLVSGRIQIHQILSDQILSDQILSDQILSDLVLIGSDAHLSVGDRQSRPEYSHCTAKCEDDELRSVLLKIQGMTLTAAE
jgi:hypothetical protein